MLQDRAEHALLAVKTFILFVWENFARLPGYVYACIIILMVDGFIGYTWTANNMTYMTKIFQKDNVESGNMYAVQYLSILIFAIPGGLGIDYIGARKALNIGLFLATVGRVILGVTTDYDVAIFDLNTFVSMSGGLITLSARIMCSNLEHPVSKVIAFILLYFASNLGVLLAFWIGPLLLGDVTHEVIANFQHLFILTACVAFFGLLAGIVGTRNYKPPVAVYDVSPNQWEFWRGVMTDEKLLKAMRLSSIFIFVRMMFSDMDTILPIYMANLYGNSASYSYTMLINPTGIILLSLVGIAFPSPFEAITQIIFGTVLASLSTLPMILWRPDDNNSWPVRLFVTLFTIAEFAWSPRLVELIVSIPPEGRKGLYSSIVGIPTMIGGLVAGLLSGRLLDFFCGVPITDSYDFWQARSCANMWLVPSGIASITWIALLLTYKQFRQQPVAQNLPNDDF